MAEDYGFKYSIGGKSILGNTNPKEIGFSSQFSTLKTYLSGLTSKAVPNGVLTTVSIAHGLGYRPAFNGYYRDTASGEVYQCSSGFENINFGRVGTVIAVHMRSDNYNLYFDIYQTTGSTKNVDIFYEVFYEDLTTEPIRFF